MDDDAIKRVEKLVRLADSTHSDHERKTALRECVRLFDETKPRRRMPRAAQGAPPNPPAPQPAWREALATQGGRCGLCKLAYRRGDPVWVRGDGAVVHGDCW